MSANNRRLILSIVWIILGIVLIALSVSGKLDGSFYSGMGGGLIAVGILQTIRHIKYNRNPEYREKVDTEVHDERNRFIRMKAWSITGYITVLGSAVASIAVRFGGNKELGQYLSYTVCAVLLIYLISYVAVSRKN